MDVSRKELENLFSETLQEVTHRVGGIQLSQKDATPESGDVYTVYVSFERGVHSRLCLSADKSMFIRLTQYMMRREEVSPQDVEDFSKEYFNVVCGHIASKLYQTTKVASRFGVPSFCSGRYQPADYEEHLVLNYSGDQSEGAQLIHLLPLETPTGEWAGLRADQAPALNERSIQTMGKRIMIVDDSRAVAFQVSGLLEDTDYEVVACCQSGEDAIAEYAAIQPDIITMDIIMPGMDGLETAHAILEEHPEAKIVMVSSLAYEDTLKEASEIGAKAFIYKPFDRDELLNTLDRVITGN